MKIKALLFALMLFGAVCAQTFGVPDADASGTVCRYCKSPNRGDCGQAPLNDRGNPQRKHKHRSNGKNCVWCGLQNNPLSCSFSPDGEHEL